MRARVLFGIVLALAGGAAARGAEGPLCPCPDLIFRDGFQALGPVGHELRLGAEWYERSDGKISLGCNWPERPVNGEACARVLAAGHITGWLFEGATRVAYTDVLFCLVRQPVAGGAARVLVCAYIPWKAVPPEPLARDAPRIEPPLPVEAGDLLWLYVDRVGTGGPPGSVPYEVQSTVFLDVPAEVVR